MKIINTHLIKDPHGTGDFNCIKILELENGRFYEAIEQGGAVFYKKFDKDFFKELEKIDI